MVPAKMLLLEGHGGKKKENNEKVSISLKMVLLAFEKVWHLSW